MRELSYTGLRHADDRGQVIVSREKYIYIYIQTRQSLSLSLSLCIYCMLYANIFVYIYIYLFIYLYLYICTQRPGPQNTDRSKNRQTCKHVLKWRPLEI